MTSLSIVGAGKIGRAVGRHWLRAGHRVTFGVRSPLRPESGPDPVDDRLRVVSIPDAIDAGNPILLAVPYAALDELTRTVGARLVGKIVIDAVNPAGSSPDGHLVSTLPFGVTAGTDLAHRLPGATIVRAFSHVMDELLVSRGTNQPLRWAMAVAGDDPDAKRITSDLVRDTGFTPVDIGDLAGSAPLDPGGILFPNMFTPADLRSAIESCVRS